MSFYHLTLHKSSSVHASPPPTPPQLKLSVGWSRKANVRKHFVTAKRIYKAKQDFHTSCQCLILLFAVVETQRFDDLNSI